MIDKEAIAVHVRGILAALGADPDRAGLKETPQRVANMYEEVFAGMNYSNQELAALFAKTFAVADDNDVTAAMTADKDRIVVMKDIEFFSYCEHHLALMYDMKATVAYIPGSMVIGLSKIARICDMAGRRLQLQERIGADIADILSRITGSQDIAVLIEGRHSCVTCRGIRKMNTKTCTAELRGRFKTETALQLYLK